MIAKFARIWVIFICLQINTKPYSLVVDAAKSSLGADNYQQPQLPTANMADADLATERYVHANIKGPFRGLGFVYDRMACLHLLNTAIWFTCRDFSS